MSRRRYNNANNWGILSAFGVVLVFLTVATLIQYLSLLTTIIIVVVIVVIAFIIGLIRVIRRPMILLKNAEEKKGPRNT